jgi:SAM-dependent methyltransferase
VVDARTTNARNNADHQHLRFERWSDVRDAAWSFLEPIVERGASVLLVGAGNGDDLPLARLSDVAARITLVDIDADAVERCRTRLSEEQRSRVDVLLTDVTDGAADRVLGSVGSWWRQTKILPSRAPLANERYDVVIADMLYTQLLHPGLIALGLTRAQQSRAMQRYDAILRDALIARLHASARPGGTIVHIHDLACWTTDHPQPVDLDRVLDRPDAAWGRLRRHDACDPLLGERAHGTEPTSTAWWPWRFEPKTSYLVRACSVPARST